MSEDRQKGPRGGKKVDLGMAGAVHDEIQDVRRDRPCGLVKREVVLEGRLDS